MRLSTAPGPLSPAGTPSNSMTCALATPRSETAPATIRVATLSEEQFMSAPPATRSKACPWGVESRSRGKTARDEPASDEAVSHQTTPRDRFLGRMLPPLLTALFLAVSPLTAPTLPRPIKTYFHRIARFSLTPPSAVRRIKEPSSYFPEVLCLPIFLLSRLF